MKLSRLAFPLITLILALLGCNLIGGLRPTATPLSTSPTATLEAALPISPTEPTPTDSLPILVSPTPLPTPIIPSGWVPQMFPLFGIESLHHPPEYDYAINERFSVDGVRAESPNTFSLLNPDPATNFIIGIENVNRAFEQETVTDQAFADMPCIGSIAAEPFEMIGWFNAALYRNTPCGPRGSTLLYVFDSYNGHTFYRISIASPHPYETVEPLVKEVLGTIVFTQHSNNIFPPPTP